MNVSDVKGRVDFGILTIRDDEYEAVLRRLPELDTVEARRRYRIRQLLLRTDESYTIATLRCVEQGNTEALNTARDLLEDLDPCFLLVVGIAGGVPSYDFTLGDVIVSTRIADFSVEAVLKDHGHEYALGGGPLDTKAAILAADIRGMVHDGKLVGWNTRHAIEMGRPPVDIADDNFYGDNDWKKNTRAKLKHHFVEKKARSPRVVTGAIASSDRLIKEAETIQVWLKIARQIQAVEMESAGIYKAAHGRAPFLAIRGISDIVGFNRDPGWTEYACRSAASFMRSFLLARPFPPCAAVSMTRTSESVLGVRPDYPDLSIALVEPENGMCVIPNARNREEDVQERLNVSASLNGIPRYESILDTISHIKRRAEQAYKETGGLTGLHASYPENDAEAYAKAVYDWYICERKYFNQQHIFQTELARAFRLVLDVRNSGRSPASGVKVEIRFQAGVTVKSSIDKPHVIRLSVPLPPNGKEKCNPRPIIGDSPWYIRRYENVRLFDNQVEWNFHGLVDDTVTWRTEIDNIQHGETKRLSALYVVFGYNPSADLKLKCKLHATNQPDDKNSEINIRVMEGL